VAVSEKSFGSCCETLKEAMGGAEFEPLISVGEDDGVLYLTVGWIDVEDEQPGARRSRRLMQRAPGSPADPVRNSKAEAVRLSGHGRTGSGS
jgi:hypothetical protein